MKPRPIYGANQTRIHQRAGIDLVVKYWSNISPTLTNHTLFVGDVHGDIHQFIAPLIMSGIITLTGTIDEIPNETAYESHLQSSSPKSPDDTTITPITPPAHFDELTLYIPKYTINTSSKSTVIYLGDMIHEWIYSRVIVYILLDLLRRMPDKVVFIYGNHDCGVLAMYPLYCRRLLHIERNMLTTYETMVKEMNMYRSLHFYKFTVEYENDPQKGIEFVYAYLNHLIEPLHYIYAHQLGRISYPICINNVPILISHTVWDMRIILKYALNNTVKTNIQSIHSSVYDRANSAPISAKNKKLMIDLYNSICDNQKHPDSSKITKLKFTFTEYKCISDAMNGIFDSLNYVCMSNNIILYNRLWECMFVNQITGHTPGFVWRDADINISPCTYNHERLDKIQHPTKSNGRTLYYIDFLCSAGYDLTEISRPDFVYIDSQQITIDNHSSDANKIPNDMLTLTNLPSFNYILHNHIDCMLVCDAKTKRKGTSTIIDGNVDDVDDNDRDADDDSNINSDDVDSNTSDNID